MLLYFSLALRLGSRELPAPGHIFEGGSDNPLILGWVIASLLPRGAGTAAVGVWSFSSSLGGFDGVAFSPRFHADRALGGHCHHRGPDRAAPARRAGGAGGGASGAVREQPEAVGHGLPQLQQRLELA